MLNPLAALPLHLACQLLLSQNSSDPNISLASRSPKLTTELPSGYTVFSDIGLAYKYHKTQVSWAAARKYCAGEDGNLAVIDSYEKIQLVMNLHTRLKDPDVHVHVGMHRIFDQAEWVDVKNGSPVAAIPWRTRTYGGETNRHCMALAGPSDVGLFAINCDSHQSFVCEVSIFN